MAKAKRILIVRSVVENIEVIIVKESELMHTVQIIFLYKHDCK